MRPDTLVSGTELLPPGRECPCHVCGAGGADHPSRSAGNAGGGPWCRLDSRWRQWASWLAV